MKRLSAIVIALCTMVHTVWAYDFSVVVSSGQTLYFNIDSNTVSVTYPSPYYYSPYNGYTKPTGNLVIPSSVTNNGTTYTVTTIGEYAFGYCYDLTSVTIPDSVTSIEEYAFEYCHNLTSVTIPNSVTSIGEWAFRSCTGLTSATIPNLITSIEEGSFYGCSGLTSVTIPNSVTSIGSSAFYLCTGLTSVTIPNSVTSIGEYAFEYCSNLTSITIPNSVTSIGNYVFSECCGLTSITIPDSVTSIGEGTFYECTGLTSVTIPNSVTSIENSAFYGCIGLTSVSIPNSVSSIGGWAFAYCSGLTSVTISNSVTSIEEFTFYYCSDLTSATIPDSVNSIGGWAFAYCSGLTSVIIPDSVTSIGEYAFSECSGLTSITIPDSITSIEEGAFSYCTGLTSIIIPNLVTSIGEYAFYYCSNLTSVTIPNSVTSIGEYAFEYCSNLTSVTIPNSVTSIGDYAFKNCSSLISVTIPNWVTSIGDYAFANCGSLNVIICKSTIPPTTSPTAWVGGPTNTNVYVPCGSSSVYSAYIAWSRFNNIQDTSYNIELSVNESLMGYAELLLNTCDSTIIEATPNRGYTFLNWSDGDTNNPRIITLTGDTTLIAYFEANNYTVTVTSANDSMGTVSGGGEYAFGSEVTITATAAESYCFVSWSDGDTNNPRIITLTSDTAFVAYFALNNYTVTVISANDSMGTVSGGGEYAFGSEVTITATAAEGYRFVSWNDGDTNNPRIITLTGDTTFIANFERITGIEDVAVINARVYSSHSRIVVEGADGNNVMLFDMSGRLLATKRDEYSRLEFEVPISGAYFVKIGNYKAQKIVVIK